MKKEGFLTRTEWGLLVLTAIFLCLMVCILHQSQTGEISGDYVIITERTPPEPVTPVVDPVPLELLGRVNINTADSEALQQLSGIGPVLAERIIAYREEHGPFTAPEDLLAVKGIGEATLAGIREDITLGNMEEDT